jgi:hypothetical protein
VINDGASWSVRSEAIYEEFRSDGRVVRALVNILQDDKLGDLPQLLAETYGSHGATRGAVTTWSLPGGIVATLNIGAAVSLVVESLAAPHAPSSASPVAASAPPTAASSSGGVPSINVDSLPKAPR